MHQKFEKIKYMKEINSLTEWSQKLPKVTVSELIEQLQTLPQDQEIVIYPKYDDVDGFHRHRFRIDNVIEQEQSDGHRYCAILF